MSKAVEQMRFLNGARWQARQARAMVPVGREACAASVTSREEARLSERRRTSFALVLLDEHDVRTRFQQDRSGAAILVRQARHSGIALLLASLCVPLVLAIEPLAGLLPWVFVNIRSSAPCEGLSMDERSAVNVAVALLATISVGLSTAIVVAVSLPGFPRIIPHCWLSVATAAVYCWWYARGVEPVSGAAVIGHGGLGAALILLAPLLSLAAWYIATARPSWRLAALLLVTCVAFAFLGAVFGTAVAIYATLSDNISGYAGVVINGKTGHRLAVRLDALDSRH
jgi:hypothetical protein